MTKDELEKVKQEYLDAAADAADAAIAAAAAIAADAAIAAKHDAWDKYVEALEEFNKKD